MENEDEFGIVGAMLAGAYYVERVVAHGGFAVVYRGFHSGFRAPIALKCLRIPDGMTALQRSTFLERFREEGEFLFRLSAAIPEVVRPLHIDAVQLPSGVLMPFLALEWLEGEGLDQMLERRRAERGQGMDLPSLVEALRPVAQALSRAHNFPTDRGNVCVVHRDLKPENLFMCSVAGAQSIKILDYGIAEVCSVAQEVSGARGWASGMNPFTPGYGAPEQWAPERFGASGPWTDVWGLAITMVEALIGRPPIDGEIDEMRRVALDPRQRPTPRALGCAISSEAESAFQRALALNPRERTPDIETFWTEVEIAAGAEPSMARHAAPVSRRPVRRAAERDLSDVPAEASVDLDLAVAPESLRAPPARALTPSVPPGRASMPSIPAGRGSMTSVPPSSRRELSLPTRDDPPLSQRAPASQRAPTSSQRGSRAAITEAAPPSSRPRAAEAPPALPALPARSVLDEPESPVKQVAGVITGRFKAPSILLGAAILISVADLAAVRIGGEPITLGPVRSLWIAGPLAILGALLLIWKIVGDSEDG